ncbi:MAG: hypothetical protein AB1510_00685 [Bacillota bacterium]
MLQDIRKGQNILYSLNTTVFQEAMAWFLAVMGEKRVLLMGVLYAVTITVALGYNLNAGLIVKGVVAVLLTLIGNMLGQIRHNYFVGIKTPWDNGKRGDMATDAPAGGKGVGAGRPCMPHLGAGPVALGRLRFLYLYSRDGPGSG